MRKLFFLLVLVSGMLTAQTPNATNTQTIGKFLKLSKVPSGLETDNVLVRGTDGIVKFVPRSEFAGGSQVNADWNAIGGPSEILNKPIIPTVVPQVNADWNATSGSAMILNKPVIPPSGWSLSGNNVGTNGFIGTLDYQPIRLKIGNEYGGKITASGNQGSVYIGVHAGLGELPYDTQQSVAIGQMALRESTNGINNTAIGFNSLRAFNKWSSGDNTGVGSYSGQSITTGTRNTVIGVYSGGNLTTGSGNTLIGNYSLTPNATDSNYIVLSSGSGITRASFDGTNWKFQGQINKAALDTAPASATAPGTVGEIRFTATHVYWCVATNTWIRAAGSTW